MARAVPFSPLATYTVIPLTSSIPEDDFSSPIAGSTITVGKSVLIFVILLMIVTTIVGNALVCLAVLLVRKLQQPANYLIVSLAVADCLVGLLVMPLALVELVFDDWPLGRAMCKLWTTADLTLCTASIVNLCMISVDRYLVISSPLRYTAVRTASRMMSYIAVVWTIAALVSLSSHIIGNLLYEDGADTQHGCQVIPHFAYQIYATIISFYGPTVIMVILYVKIWRAAKRLARKDRSLSQCNGHEVDKNGNESSDLLDKKVDNSSVKGKISGSKLFRSDRKYLHRPSAIFQAVKIRNNDGGQDCKARKTLGVIMSVFIICWFPFFLFAILKSCLGVEIPYWLDSLALWLGYSNSTLNPAIYCKYNKEFRVPFREILSCRCGTLQMVLRQQSFTSRYGTPTRMRSTSHSGVTPLLARRPSSHAECSDV